MENVVIISGIVETCQIWRKFTEVSLAVEATSDVPMHYLGAQSVTVRIPAQAMPALPIPVGTLLRVRGTLIGNVRPFTLAEIVEKTAPGLLQQIDWSLDPTTVRHLVTYSYVLAHSVLIRETPEALNYVMLEGEVVSRPKNSVYGQTFLRVANYPDEPLGYDSTGTRELATYATISGRRGLYIPLRRNIRVKNGMLFSVQQDLSLAWLATFYRLNLVWPDGFDPRQAVLRIHNLAVAAESVLEIEPMKVVREIETLDAAFPNPREQYAA